MKVVIWERLEGLGADVGEVKGGTEPPVVVVPHLLCAHKEVALQVIGEGVMDIRYVHLESQLTLSHTSFQGREESSTRRSGQQGENKG